uniref:uncharacterized protein LOC129520501 isoform X2 n=1 Tax=Nyctereutes procyonoides TaxID=34880 RepID=UPI0024448A19|nr:uncharacterized protein LOC129520501 isoform X2 [Nyctereutes procyonoides]
MGSPSRLPGSGEATRGRAGVHPPCQQATPYCFPLLIKEALNQPGAIVVGGGSSGEAARSRSDNPFTPTPGLGRTQPLQMERRGENPHQFPTVPFPRPRGQPAAQGGKELRAPATGRAAQPRTPIPPPDPDTTLPCKTKAMVGTRPRWGSAGLSSPDGKEGARDPTRRGLSFTAGLHLWESPRPAPARGANHTGSTRGTATPKASSLVCAPGSREQEGTGQGAAASGRQRPHEVGPGATHTTATGALATA